MARPATIFHQKITFSLPGSIIESLQLKAPKNKRSEFVAEAIKEKLSREKVENDVHGFFAEFRKTAKIIPGPSSLEILRKARHEI